MNIVLFIKWKLKVMNKIFSTACLVLYFVLQLVAVVSLTWSLFVEFGVLQLVAILFLIVGYAVHRKRIVFSDYINSVC